MSATLTIRRRFDRPSRDELALFRDVSTGFVVDAMGRLGAIDHTIRQMTPGNGGFVGPALTVRTAARDNLAPYAALDVAEPGDVLMIATGDFAGASVVGDLFVGMARNCGAVAVVTDGLVRDMAGIGETGLPLFARGPSPNSPGKNGPGSVGLPISLGSVPVNSGDLVVGDRDGVVVVPRRAIRDVAKALETVAAKEQDLDARVRAGLKQPDWLAERLSAPDIAETD